jgi:RND superfamily putative drug exporter
MNRLGFTGRLATRASRRPWLTLGIWAIVLVVAYFGVGRLGDVVINDGGLTIETESSIADDLVEDRFNQGDASGAAGTQEFVLVESAGLTLEDAEFAAYVETLAAELRNTETVSGVTSALDGAPGLTSQDGHTALLVARLAAGEEEDMAEPVVAVVEAADENPSFRVTTIGDGSVGVEFMELADETLARGEMFGISIALVVLVLVFGAAIAAGIPLVVAMASILLSLALAALVGTTFNLSFFVINMITMIGLAVGIDYTLFIVQRFREERAKGSSIADAVVLAANSASRAVLFSGITVVIALTGLLVLPDIIMRSLGIGAILVVLVSVMAALTLLPAVLRLLGDRVNRLKVPFASRSHYREGGGRFWHRVTRVVTARPVLSVILASSILLTAAVPFLTMTTGQNFLGSLPEDSNSLHAFTVLNEEFDTGAVTTPIVVAAPDVSTPEIETATAELASILDANPVYGDIEMSVAPSGDLLVLDAVTKLDPASAESRAALTQLRDEVIPTTFGGTGADVYVSGDTARIADYAKELGVRTPYILAFVLALSFVLLMVVFRSIVVPLKAILMNLLSVGAAYGLLVLVFQHGVGAGLLGFKQVDNIEAWLPMFLFAVLFGLSMDYHIFLLSRIRERYDATGDNVGSVAFGLGSTGAIITGAALIMVAVFGGFAAGDLVMFQQMGFGLAAAIILDATIVRSVLVPASMALLGDWNWYLPRWLRWLPKIEIEVREPVIAPSPLPEEGAA